MAGVPKPKCGSLASKGLPEAVRSPEITQLLLPLPSTKPGSPKKGKDKLANALEEVCWALLVLLGVTL
jgi:hypothetical protein